MILTIIAIAFMAVGGTIFLLCEYGQFIAMALAGVGVVILLYQSLNRLQGKKPRLARTMRRTLTILIVVFTGLLFITEGFIISSAKRDRSQTPKYVLVLGAAVEGKSPSLSLSERLKAAKNYIEENPESICVVSGGQGSGESITEAACMYDWLTAHGVAPDRIWQENRAGNTQENIEYALNLIQEKTGERPEVMAVVSSEYHLFRAGLVAGRLGVKIVPWAAETTLPLLKWNYYLREAFGVWYYTLFH